MLVVLGQEYPPRPVLKNHREKGYTFWRHENRAQLLVPKHHEKFVISGHEYHTQPMVAKSHKKGYTFQRYKNHTQLLAPKHREKMHRFETRISCAACGAKMSRKRVHISGARKSHPNFGIKTSQKVVIISGQEYRPQPVVRKLREKKTRFGGTKIVADFWLQNVTKKVVVRYTNIICGLWCENDGKSTETRRKKVVVLGQEYRLRPMV